MAMMLTRLTPIPMALLFLCLFSCKSPEKVSENSKLPPNWEGSYSGIVPCANCEGISTTLILDTDQHYSLHTLYLGKDQTVNNANGTFTWNKESNVITLNDLKEGPRYYKVGENQLVQLDQQGQPITGTNANQYVLTKATNDPTNKYWKLIEVMGQPVVVDSLQNREPHMILHPTDNRVSGNGGCNSFTGTYQLEANNRIRFSPIAATKMACMNSMEVENQFFKALESADSYYVKGDSLQLIRARMAPLARFVAVYLR
jgi:copper homeostasis protein (lipoprotein)